MAQEQDVQDGRGNVSMGVGLLCEKKKDLECFAVEKRAKDAGESPPTNLGRMGSWEDGKVDEAGESGVSTWRHARLGGWKLGG